MFKWDKLSWIASGIFVLGIILGIWNNFFFGLLIVAYLLRPTILAFGKGKKYADERQIVGYATSGCLKELLSKIWESKKVNEKESYLFDCKIHRNEMDLLERILKSIPRT